MSNRIDGRKLADDIIGRARHDVALAGFTPGFAAVLVGDDAASHLYVSLKEKACRKAGIAFEKLYFAADASQGVVARAITALNGRADVDAILLQLPLPAHLDADQLIRTITPEKDVDGFHPENLALLKSGAPRIIPGLAASVSALLMAPGEPLAGKRALVVSNSRTFYEPLEVTLASLGMTSAWHSASAPDLAAAARAADALIVAAGVPDLITAAMVKAGAILIDVGTNRVPDGKGGSRTVGDVSADAAAAAAHVTPVPGGVGPVTVAMVVRNCMELAKRRR